MLKWLKLIFRPHSSLAASMGKCHCVVCQEEDD